MKLTSGAFLIPYVIMLMLVGLPLFLLESAVGQFSSSSCLTLYSVAPAFKGKRVRRDVFYFCEIVLHGS